MWHAFIIWINNEYWGVSWPNIFAPSIWTILPLGYTYLKTRAQAVKLNIRIDGLHERHDKLESNHREILSILRGGNDHETDVSVELSGESGPDPDPRADRQADPAGPVS